MRNVPLHAGGSYPAEQASHSSSEADVQDTCPVHCAIAVQAVIKVQKELLTQIE